MPPEQGDEGEDLLIYVFDCGPRDWLVPSPGKFRRVRQDKSYCPMDYSEHSSRARMTNPTLIPMTTIRVSPHPFQ